MKFTNPFSAPPPRKAPKVKRDTAAEYAEKAYVRARDRECVAQTIRLDDGSLLRDISPCQGPRDVDHVRASGGLGMKSPTHRTNMVVLCRHHHRLKTEYGREWRPHLLDYLERVQGPST